MLEIIQVSQQIYQKLALQNVNDLIIQSFILGNMQGKNKELKLFQQNLETLENLNSFMKMNFQNKDRIYQFFNDFLQGSQDLNKLFNELEGEVISMIQSNQIKNTSSFIFTPSNDYSQIIYQSQQNQNQNQNQIVQSQWEIFQDQSKLYQTKQLQLASDIYQQQISNNNKDESKSNELAIKLQKQSEQEQQLQALNFQLNFQNNLDIMELVEKNQIECKICLEKIPQYEMALLYCSHVFHKNCLNQYCIIELTSRKIPIQCPSKCNQTLIYQDLKVVLDSEKLMDFQLKMFEAYVNNRRDELSWCPTPNCKYIFAVERNSHLNCPVCRKSYCLECQTEYHNGFSCQEYKVKRMTDSELKKEKYLEDRFQSFIRKNQCKQCPKCKFWVEKINGCDHMTCRCKFQFCYICGGVYKKCGCYKNSNWFTNLINR